MLGRDTYVHANYDKKRQMAAMKPGTGGGPLETTKEGRGIVMCILNEGGDQLIIELTSNEASKFAPALSAAA